GTSTHPSMQSLARFLMMRSVRCRRLSRSYLEQARVALHLQRERFRSDFRPAYWAGILYLLENRFSEARRELEAAERLSGGPAAVVAAACADLLLGDPRMLTPRQRDRLRVASAADPAVHVLERTVTGTRAGPGRYAHLAVEGWVAPTGALIYPAGEAARNAWESSGSEPVSQPAGRTVLHLQGLAFSPVTVRGTGGARRLTALEGELLLAFLSLLAVKPDGIGSLPDALSDRPLTRDVWVGAVWPSTPGTVGRLDGVFSAAIRSLRLKLEAACLHPVIEASRRGGYRLSPGALVRLQMDVATLAGNWLLARVPAPGRPEVP
ncbi:MAG: hypothetical protein AB1609_05125, partial [Bacillota bacterium]